MRPLAHREDRHPWLDLGGRPELQAGLRQLRASRRYLYSLPRLWAEYDPQKKALKAPARIVERMYKEAKL